MQTTRGTRLDGGHGPVSVERAPSSPSPACEACEASSGAFGEGLGVVFFRFVSVLRCFASRCYVTFQIL